MNMEDLFMRYWHNLIARTEGPMNLRFYIQPAMSLFFAIRAAIKDARNGTVPYLWRFMVSKGKRGAIAKEGWKDFGKICIVGTVLDTIYQLIVIFKLKTESDFYPLETITVAVCLGMMPYLLFRGPVNRVVSWLRGKRDE
jgi:hypothetical protein